MGEIKRLRMARGQRVIEVEPSSTGSVAITTIQVNSGCVTVHLDKAERRQLVEALGGVWA
jgi:hypothetical protein